MFPLATSRSQALVRAPVSHLLHASDRYTIDTRAPLGGWKPIGSAMGSASQAYAKFQKLTVSPGYSARLMRNGHPIDFK